MIPIRDRSTTRTTPIITYLLLAMNIGIFVLMFSMGNSGLESFIDRYAMIPTVIVRGENYYTLLSSMFIHGGIGHIFSNMIFLNVFGDNLEDEFGHFGYLLFYLTAGLGASALQIIVNPNLDVPNLGASGAIAGLLGGYLILFPRHKIEVLVPIGFVFSRALVPASFMLLYWIGFQLFQGIGTLGIQGGGVAYFAHVGGFITGIALTFLYKLVKT